MPQPPLKMGDFLEKVRELNFCNHAYVLDTILDSSRFVFRANKNVDENEKREIAAAHQNYIIKDGHECLKAGQLADTFLPDNISKGLLDLANGAVLDPDSLQNLMVEIKKQPPKVQAFIKGFILQVIVLNNRSEIDDLIAKFEANERIDPENYLSLQQKAKLIKFVKNFDDSSTGLIYGDTRFYSLNFNDWLGKLVEDVQLAANIVSSSPEEIYWGKEAVLASEPPQGQKVRSSHDYIPYKAIHKLYKGGVPECTVLAKRLTDGKKFYIAATDRHPLNVVILASEFAKLIGGKHFASERILDIGFHASTENPYYDNKPRSIRTRLNNATNDEETRGMGFINVLHEFLGEADGNVENIGFSSEKGGAACKIDYDHCGIGFGDPEFFIPANPLENVQTTRGKREQLTALLKISLLSDLLIETMVYKYTVNCSDSAKRQIVKNIKDRRDRAFSKIKELIQINKIGLTEEDINFLDNQLVQYALTKFLDHPKFPQILSSFEARREKVVKHVDFAFQPNTIQLNSDQLFDMAFPPETTTAIPVASTSRTTNPANLSSVPTPTENVLAPAEEERLPLVAETEINGDDNLVETTKRKFVAILPYVRAERREDLANKVTSLTDNYKQTSPTTPNIRSFFKDCVKLSEEMRQQLEKRSNLDIAKYVLENILCTISTLGIANIINRTCNGRYTFFHTSKCTGSHAIDHLIGKLDVQLSKAARV